MESDGAIVKDAEAQISDLLSTIRGRDKNVARKKQIIKKKQLHTKKVLEQTINDCLKDLMKIININLMRDQMSSKLWIDRQESDEEQNCASAIQQIKLKPKWNHANNLNNKSENVDIFWSEEQINESLLKRKKREHLSNAQIAYILRQLDRFPKSLKLMQKSTNYLDLHWEGSLNSRITTNFVKTNLWFDIEASVG